MSTFFSTVGYWWRDVLIASLICFIAGLLAPSAKAGSINTSFSDGATYGSQSTNVWFEHYYLQANVNSTEAVDRAQLSYYNWEPLTTRVIMSFDVKKGSTPKETMAASHTMNFDINGRQFNAYVSTGVYSGGKGLTDGDNSYGNASLSLPAYDILRTDASSHKGRSYTSDQNGTIIEDWNVYSTYWDITFISQKGFQNFQEALGAMGVEAVAVPEPSVLMLFAFSPLVLLARRPQRAFARA
jgi:hypothetical protein